MRRPYYDSSRKRWRLIINQPSGPPRKVTLGADKATAFRAWRSMQDDEANPNQNVCERCRRRKVKAKGPKPAELPKLNSRESNDEGDPEEFYLSNELAHRYRMTERVLLLVELLHPLRRGATIKELRSDVEESTGKVCERTIKRDLQFLMTLGVVDRVGKRFRWRDVGNRASAFSSTARMLSEEREGRFVP